MSTQQHILKVTALKRKIRELDTIILDNSSGEGSGEADDEKLNEYNRLTRLFEKYQKILDAFNLENPPDDPEKHTYALMDFYSNKVDKMIESVRELRKQGREIQEVYEQKQMENKASWKKYKRTASQNRASLKPLIDFHNEIKKLLPSLQDFETQKLSEIEEIKSFAKKKSNQLAMESDKQLKELDQYANQIIAKQTEKKAELQNRIEETNESIKDSSKAEKQLTEQLQQIQKEYDSDVEELRRKHEDEMRMIKEELENELALRRKERESKLEQARASAKEEQALIKQKEDAESQKYKQQIQEKEKLENYKRSIEEQDKAYEESFCKGLGTALQNSHLHLQENLNCIIISDDISSKLETSVNRAKSAKPKEISSDTSGSTEFLVQTQSPPVLLQYNEIKKDAIALCSGDSSMIDMFMLSEDNLLRWYRRIKAQFEREEKEWTEKRQRADQDFKNAQKIHSLLLKKAGSGK